MEVTHRINYDINNSAARLDDILGPYNRNFPDLDEIPARKELKFTNGYYVNVSALFIDIIGSSDMTNVHYRPTLAKIYRCFISECTAIMNDAALGDLCKEINIHGDCVWGVFDTSSQKDFNTVLSVALKLKDMINTLNDKLKKRGYHTIEVGIGVDYGRALMVKAGYDGSGLNDVIWMGDVVNTACHLANKAGRQGKSPILISENIYHKLSYYDKKFFDWSKDVIYYEYITNDALSEAEAIAILDNSLDRLLNQNI